MFVRMKSVAALLLFFTFPLFLSWSCGHAKKTSLVEPIIEVTKEQRSIEETQTYRGRNGKRYFVYPSHFPSKWAVTGDSVLQYFEDSFHIREAYNTAKWLTYCYACFDTVRYTAFACVRYWVPQYRLISELDIVLSELDPYAPHPPSQPGFEYGLSLAVRDRFVYSDETIVAPAYRRYYEEYVFYDLFFFRDTQNVIAGFGKAINNSAVANRTWLYEKNWKKFAYEKTCVVAHAIKVFRNPYQPEIIKYVREHPDKIHPWFLAEAKKRGMFDSVRFSPKWVDSLVAISNRGQTSCLSL
jgi:hypothetical protein